MRNGNQVWHGDQTRYGEKITVWNIITPPALVKISGDMSADAQSVCGS